MRPAARLEAWRARSPFPPSKRVVVEKRVRATAFCTDSPSTGSGMPKKLSSEIVLEACRCGHCLAERRRSGPAQAASRRIFHANRWERFAEKNMSPCSLPGPNSGPGTEPAHSPGSGSTSATSERRPFAHSIRRRNGACALATPGQCRCSPHSRTKCSRTLCGAVRLAKSSSQAALRSDRRWPFAGVAGASGHEARRC